MKCLVEIGRDGTDESYLYSIEIWPICHVLLIVPYFCHVILPLGMHVPARFLPSKHAVVKLAVSSLCIIDLFMCGPSPSF